jgi:hypothetical protein
LRDGKQYGPYPYQELLRRAELGEIRAEDMFWRPGFAEWTPASSIPGLLRPPEATPSPVSDNPLPPSLSDIEKVIAKVEPTGELSIRDITFNDLKALELHITRWIYPARNVSAFFPLFTGPQRAAINFYGWVAIATAVAGLVLAIRTGVWWWFALLLLAPVIWGANRKSMEQFFVENLANDPAFFDAVKQSQGDDVKLVLKPTKR